MKSYRWTDPKADEKTLRHGVPESERGRDRCSRSVADVPPAPSPWRPYARVAAIGVTVRVAPAEKGKPVSKEPMTEKSVPVPERKSMIEKPIPVPEAKSIADKMIAVECGASHPGVTKAAEVAPAKAAEMPATKAASVAATATVHGGRTQS